MPTLEPCLFLFAACVRYLLDDHCGLVRRVAPIVVLPKVDLQQIANLVIPLTSQIHPSSHCSVQTLSCVNHSKTLHVMG